MEKTLIEVKNLSYTYPTHGEINSKKNEPVLNDLSFQVTQGEFVGIIGRNGSGKSTLAKILNAVLIPEQGDVIIDGMNTKDEAHLWTIRQTAGMVFQNPDNQLVATIVEEDVAFGPENLGIPSEEIRERVEAALNTVNMGAYKKKKPHQLSGGQKQRIAIAGILAMEPKCIIFDEATAMLDPHGRKEVMATIWKLNREQGLTVLYITHHMEELIEADRILVMDGGKIVLEGQPRQVFGEIETLKQYYLDVPQMTSLAVALNQKGIKVPSDCLSVSEMVAALASYLPVPHDQKDSLSDPFGKTEPAEMAKMPSVLRTEHLGHIYSEGSPFEQVALQDINVSIHQGEFIGLIGHTGCGKTTFIQHLNGLMTPTEGKVFFEDQNIFTQGKKALLQVRRKVGLVFQYPEHQLFEETVAKDVAFGPLKAGLSEKEVMERVDWALDIVGLKDNAIKVASPFSLSGGQMRRVAIAGILAMKPKVLILDEPTAGLDPYGRTEILNQISIMHRQEKMTVILISHSMEEISQLADRIMVMHQGKLVLFDRPQVIFEQSDQLTSIGLGVPEVTSLIDQLREKKYAVPSGIFTVDQAVSVLTSLFDQKKGAINV